MKTRSGRTRTCAHVDTNFPNHRKLDRIPSGGRRGRAIGVWAVALCHSRLHEPGGFCPTEVLGAFGDEEVIQELVDVGLFARSERHGLKGVLVLDYAQCNPTKPNGKGAR